MDLNKVMLIGRITSDIQLRTIPSGQSVASFGVATNRRWKDQNTGEMKEDSQFHNIVAWRKLAEICSQYMSKGMKVFVEGRLQTRSWDDQQTGQKKYRTEILAENIIMLDKKSNDGGSQNFQQPNRPQPQAPSSPVQENNINIPSPAEIPTIDLDDNQEEIKVEDIPF
jgi:single-strand DNA-binding protein